MSLVSSPSSSDALPAPQVKAPFKDSPLRPIICCGGALGLGLVLASLLVKPATPAAGVQNRPELILPRETTLIVRPTRPPGAILRGRVHLVADVMGRAPVGGAVARQLVETGAQVRRGDAVLEISSGQAVRRAPATESQQNAAERSQIAATDAQAALAQKVIIAQSQLRGAQERVERAQAQVVAARDLVRRLQNGEAVPASGIPAPFRAAATPKTRVRTRRSAPARANRAGEVALQQASAAQDAAREGARDLQSARQTLVAAQSNARAAAEKLKNAAQSQTQVEARFDEKKASGADVEAARAAQKEAQNGVVSAAKTVASAQAEVERREKSASSLEKYAEKARLLAKNAPAPVVAPEEDESASNSEPEAARGGAGVTLDQAVRFAEAALNESRRASRDAERLHGEVDGYQRQIAASSAEVASASQNLAAAQQEVFNSVPRPRFTTAYAPSDGVVTWISRLAREVGRGQSVFGIARGGKVEVRFEDKSGLWRNVKAGAVLPAIVAPDAAQPDATQNASVPNGVSVRVKVAAVEAPSGEGEAARLSGQVQSAPAAPQNGDASLLRAGAVVMASVAVPGQKPTLNLPPTAILRRGDAAYVAVLTPEASSGETPAFKVRWQEVEIGRGDVMQQEIVSGLQAGAHVVAETTQLEALGLTPPSAPDGGTVSAPDASGANLLDGITVRLTAPAV